MWFLLMGFYIHVYTVEPRYNEVLGTMEITLIVISGFSLYQGKKKQI